VSIDGADGSVSCGPPFTKNALQDFTADAPLPSSRFLSHLGPPLWYGFLHDARLADEHHADLNLSVFLLRGGDGQAVVERVKGLTPLAPYLFPDGFGPREMRGLEKHVHLLFNERSCAGGEGHTCSWHAIGNVLFHRAD
jgi:hypothetical protein